MVIFPGAQFMVAISSSMISLIKPFRDGVVVPVVPIATSWAGFRDFICGTKWEAEIGDVHGCPIVG